MLTYRFQGQRNILILSFYEIFNEEHKVIIKKAEGQKVSDKDQNRETVSRPEYKHHLCRRKLLSYIYIYYENTTTQHRKKNL